MPPEGKSPDLVVVGGGVVGLAVAREAARRGLAVTVVERGEPGRAASWAAAGMLSPFGEAREGGPFLDFGLAALDAWPDWAAELEEESGTDLAYRRSGKLRVALDAEERKRLEARRAWARERGVAHTWLEPDEALAECPELSRRVTGGLLLADDHRVDNRRLGDALLESARVRGVQVRAGTPVSSVELKGDRVRGVILEDGSKVPAGAVLLAAGAWSATIGGLPSPLPVRPVRGQILGLLPGRLPSPRVLESASVYLVPRPGGRLVAGATQEEVGFDPGLTADGVRSLLAAAIELVPALAGASLHELWYGFRPGTPDGNPILGPDPRGDGLFVATGHFRNGILLAPVTARVLGALLAGEAGAAIPEAFLPRRFVGGRGGDPRNREAFAARPESRD